MYSHTRITAYPHIRVPAFSSKPNDSGNSLVDKITAFTQQTVSQPQTQTQTNTTTESTVFKSFVEQFAGEKPGPPIDQDLARIVNELLTEKLTKEKLEPVQQWYLKPENYDSNENYEEV